MKKPTIFVAREQGLISLETSITLRYYSTQTPTPPAPEVSLSIPHPDGSHQKEILEFTFTDGERWNGSFADLQHALKVAKGMKDLEESSPIAQPALKHTNQTVTLTDERRLDMLTGAFFQRLGHTPGPWTFTEKKVGPVIVTGPTSQYKELAVITAQDDSEEFNEHDIVLIAQSPAMLRTLCRTYLWMLAHLNYNNPSIVQMRIKAQEQLVDLRQAISEATGIEDKKVQETFEQYCLWIQLNEDIAKAEKRRAAPGGAL